MAMKSLQERVDEYVKEDAKLLKRLGLHKQLSINFPQRSRIPWLARFFISRLTKMGGILDTRMTSTK